MTRDEWSAAVKAFSPEVPPAEREEMATELGALHGIELEADILGPVEASCDCCGHPGARQLLRQAFLPEAEWVRQCEDVRACSRRVALRLSKRDEEQRAKDRAARNAKRAAERGVEPRRAR